MRNFLDMVYKRRLNGEIFHVNHSRHGTDDDIFPCWKVINQFHLDAKLLPFSSYIRGPVTFTHITERLSDKVLLSNKITWDSNTRPSTYVKIYAKITQNKIQSALFQGPSQHSFITNISFVNDC